MNIRFGAIALLICCAFMANANNIDSLITRTHAKVDTIRFKSLMALVQHYRHKNADSVVFFLQKAKDEIPGIKKAYNHSVYNTFLAQLYKQKGLNYHLSDNYDSAALFYNKAIEIYNQYNYLKNKAQILNNMGALYERQDNLAKALQYYYQVVDICDSISYPLQKSKSLVNIGVIHVNQQKFKDALGYYKKALALKKKLDDKRGEALLYNNIGIVYYHMNNYEKVIEYFKRSLNIYRTLNDLGGQAMPYFNIAEIYYKQNALKEALYYYKKSYEIEKKLNRKAAQAESLSAIGHVYADLKQYEDAINVQKEAIKLLRSVDGKSRLANALFNLSNTYELKGNYQKALDYYKAHKKVRDSLFTIKREAKIAEIKTQHQSEKKDQQIALLKERNKVIELENKQQQEQMQSRQRIAILSLIIVALVLLALVMIYRLYKQKQYANHILELKNDAISRKNNEKTDVVKKLEKALHARDLFFGGITAQFRKPLNAISGFVNLLRENITDHPQIDYLQQIQNNTNHLYNRIENTLTASGIESGKIELKEEGVSLKAVCQYLLSFYQNIAAQHNIELTCKIDQQCPKYITVDPAGFTHIIRNLLENAIKFTLPKGSVNIQFFWEKPNYLKIKVSDTGVGIPDDQKEAIFNRFSKLDNDIFSHSGSSGLGLNIVKKLVELYNGNIFVDSEVGKGSDFTVTIPVNIAQKATYNFGISYQEQDKEAQQKILIAKQNAENANSVCQALSTYNPKLTAEFENDIRKIREKAKKQHFELIVIDLELDRTDNLLELIHEIQAASSHTDHKTSVLGLAKNVSHALTQKYRDAGLCGIIEKTCTIDKLIVEIEKNIWPNPDLPALKLNKTQNVQISDLQNEKKPAEMPQIQNMIYALNDAIRNKEWDAILSYVNQWRSHTGSENKTIINHLNDIEKECVTTQNIERINDIFQALQKTNNI